MNYNRYDDVRMIAELMSRMKRLGIEVIEILHPFYQVEFIKDGYYHVRINPIHFTNVQETIDYINDKFKLLEYQENHS